jgi:hypothetical protein
MVLVDLADLVDLGRQALEEHHDVMRSIRTIPAYVP